MLTYTLSEFTNNRQHYASIIENPEQLLTAHTHDYFELTLVRSGACIHHINGDEIPLQTAVLSLIRPQDYHWYEPSTHNFQLINVIVPRTTINAMFAYLGNGFESSRLLDTPLPPTTQMSMSDFQSVQNELKQLILYKNVLGQKADALFHITILNIITRQFPMTLAHTHTDVPIWLQWLLLEMQKRENFVEGLPAMHRLADKSQEHICRCCRKFLKRSPTQVVNEIRLRHAARMLVEDERSIIDVCHETGFENLSNFYHLFKKQFGTSPKLFQQAGDRAPLEAYTLADAIFPNALPIAPPPATISPMRKKG